MTFAGGGGGAAVVICGAMLTLTDADDSLVLITDTNHPERNFSPTNEDGMNSDCRFVNL